MYNGAGPRVCFTDAREDLLPMTRNGRRIALRLKGMRVHGADCLKESGRHEEQYPECFLFYPGDSPVPGAVALCCADSPGGDPGAYGGFRGIPVRNKPV